MAATSALAVMAMASAYSQGEAAKAQGEFQQGAYERNSRLANMQAEDALKRGNEAASKHRTQVKGMIGSQRASMAAQGIDISDGSALEIQQDTAALGELDAVAIKNNAYREAWGYRAQAVSYQGQGELARMAGDSAARNSLLAGGLQAGSYGLQRYRTPAGTKEA